MTAVWVKQYDKTIGCTSICIILVMLILNLSQATAFLVSQIESHHVSSSSLSAYRVPDAKGFDSFATGIRPNTLTNGINYGDCRSTDWNRWEARANNNYGILRSPDSPLQQPYFVDREQRTPQPSNFYPSPRATGGMAEQELNSLSSDNHYRQQRRSSLSDNTIQGGSLKTWTNHHNHGYNCRNSDDNGKIMVELGTEGRPLDAEFELWQGPNNMAQRVRAYSEDGRARPFRAYINAPENASTTLIRNIAPLEFPLSARVYRDDMVKIKRTRRNSKFDGSLSGTIGSGRIPKLQQRGVTIQGGSLGTFPFQDPFLQTVKVTLVSEGLPIYAKIELWQGPGRTAQFAEIYSDDGYTKPFISELDIPITGYYYGGTVSIFNTGPIEFPIKAIVEPIQSTNGVNCHNGWKPSF